MSLEEVLRANLTMISPFFCALASLDMNPDFTQGKPAS